MLKANRLTAGQTLRFKPEVQLQWAVCSPSYSCNPEVRPSRRAPSVLFPSCGMCKARTKQTEVILYLHTIPSLDSTCTWKQRYNSKEVNRQQHQVYSVTDCENIFWQVCVIKCVTKSKVQIMSVFRDMYVKSTPVVSFLQQRRPRLSETKPSYCLQTAEHESINPVSERSET